MELRAWQEAAAVAADVVRIARRLRGPGSRAVADQLVRAAGSVPANIAEGFGRGLSTDGARYLVMARASAAELESHLRVAEYGGLVAADVAHDLVTRIRFARLLTHRLHASVLRRAAK